MFLHNAQDGNTGKEYGDDDGGDGGGGDDDVLLPGLVCQCAISPPFPLWAVANYDDGTKRGERGSEGKNAQPAR